MTDSPTEPKKAYGLPAGVKGGAGSGPKCRDCGSIRSWVIDSRAEGGSIRRRRVCANCRVRFSTWEFQEPPTVPNITPDDVERMIDGLNLVTTILRGGAR